MVLQEKQNSSSPQIEKKFTKRLELINGAIRSVLTNLLYIVFGSFIFLHNKNTLPSHDGFDRRTINF